MHELLTDGEIIAIKNAIIKLKQALKQTAIKNAKEQDKYLSEAMTELRKTGIA